MQAKGSLTRNLCPTTSQHLKVLNSYPNCEPPWKYILLMLHCVSSFTQEPFSTVCLCLKEAMLMMFQFITKSHLLAHPCF